MKKFLLLTLLGFGTLVFGDYTIQVINAKNSSSITPAFNKKITNTKMQKSVTKEGSCNIVTVGKYKTIKGANADLAKAKTIADDAFVRTQKRKLPEPCANQTVASTKSNITTTKQSSTATIDTITKTDIAVDNSKSIAISDANSTINSQSSSIAVVDGESKKPQSFEETTRASSEAIEKIKKESSHTATHTSIYIYDKNLARKSDIHDAIEYYKNSPYHSFRAMK